MFYFLFALIGVANLIVGVAGARAVNAHDEKHGEKSRPDAVLHLMGTAMWNMLSGVLILLVTITTFAIRDYDAKHPDPSSSTGAATAPLQEK